MAYLGVYPDVLIRAATDLVGIQTDVGAASAAAAARTTSLAAAAGDEVSAAIADLFSAFGRDFQWFGARATAFQDAFARTLVGAGLAYTEAEAEAAMAVRALSAPSPTAAATVALVMGGSGMPFPSQGYLDMVQKWIGFPHSSSLGVFTPEGLYPLTGMATLPLNESVAKGVSLLNTAIADQITAGNSVTVLGYSQSAIINSFEMRNLVAAGSPFHDRISFTLLGSPVNPNGGFLTRFPGLSLPSIGLDFWGATPSDTPYPTNVYTVQYDGYADFPRYPLNFLADLNAAAGILFVHGGYGAIDPNNLPAGFHMYQQPVSSSDVSTNYYMITHPYLPLLQPLRAVPIIGTPLADLVQPNLTYLVNLGYGDPHYGYSMGYADVPTGFGLFPTINPLTFAGDMVSGAGQGVVAFVNDVTFGQFSSILPSVPGVAQTAGTPVSVAPVSGMPSTVTIPTAAAPFGDMQAAARTGVPILTPMLDLSAAAFISVPQYDLMLFADGMKQLFTGDPVGLLNALGNPVAATTGVWTILGLWAIASVFAP